MEFEWIDAARWKGMTTDDKTDLVRAYRGSIAEEAAKDGTPVSAIATEFLDYVDEEVAAGRMRIVLARRGDEVLSVCRVVSGREPTATMLEGLETAPEHRRTGAAAAMLKQIRDNVPGTLLAHVDPAASAAVETFTSLGWQRSDAQDDTGRVWVSAA